MHGEEANIDTKVLHSHILTASAAVLDRSSLNARVNEHAAPIIFLGVGLLMRDGGLTKTGAVLNIIIQREPAGRNS